MQRCVMQGMWQGLHVTWCTVQCIVESIKCTNYGNVMPHSSSLPRRCACAWCWLGVYMWRVYRISTLLARGSVTSG
jgi:hypothetical protein